MKMTFSGASVDDPWDAAFSQVASQLHEAHAIGPGSRIAVTVGSRGISCLDEIVRGVVDAIKKYGGEPFIVPAMGSHGENDPKKKALILAHLGITEASVGAPISQTADIELAGYDESGVPVFCQRDANSANAIILVNRVKPHTDFRGDIQSGLLKMACVGLGGTLSAHWVHRLGYEHLAERVRSAGEAAIRMLKIPIGLAIVEGHSGRPALIRALEKKDILSGEQSLLKKAHENVARLPVKDLDVLIVAQMGKDVSGLGLDPLVTGRYPSGMVLKDNDVPEIYRIVVLDLTEGSEGNSAGIGLCDVTTRRLHEKTDFRSMYRNVITSRGSASARMPMVMESDREAICVGLLTCCCDLTGARVILIRDTLHLAHFFVSQSLVDECMKGGVKVIGDPINLSFDNAGRLIWPT